VAPCVKEFELEVPAAEEMLDHVVCYTAAMRWRDISTSHDSLETETSRPRLHPCIFVLYFYYCIYDCTVLLPSHILN